MFVDSQSWGFRRKTMTLFEVREEWEGWLANETAQCRKQNNLQKRCCSPLHLPCLQRELSSQSCVPAKATAQELFSSSPAFLRTFFAFRKITSFCFNLRFLTYKRGNHPSSSQRKATRNNWCLNVFSKRSNSMKILTAFLLGSKRYRTVSGLCISISF